MLLAEFMRANGLMRKEMAEDMNSIPTDLSILANT